MLVGLAGLVGVACGPGKADREVDGWPMARAALLDGESCYGEKAAYCITDPEFVDAAIQSSLDAHFEGTMPKLERDVEQLIRSARVRYYAAMREPERIAQITELVAAYYADPVVDATSTEDLVNVDLGALPGEIVVRGRVDTIVLADSPLIESFWWSGAEAGRVLAKYANEHFDKDVIRVDVLIPKESGSTKRLVYRYFRGRNRVAFGKLGDDSIYVTPEIQGGLETMAAGKLDLGQGARKLCSRPRSGSTPGWCPWQDAYGDARKKAEREAARNKGS